MAQKFQKKLASAQVDNFDGPPAGRLFYLPSGITELGMMNVMAMFQQLPEISRFRHPRWLPRTHSFVLGYSVS
jgi:hypothetical protein